MTYIKTHLEAFAGLLVASAVVLAVVGLIAYGKRLEVQKQAILSLHEQVQVRTAERDRVTRILNTERAEAAAQSKTMQQYQKEASEAHAKATQYSTALRSAQRVRWTTPEVQPRPGEATPADSGRVESAGAADVPPAFAADVADLLSEADALALKYNTLLRIAQGHTCEIPK